MGVCAPYWVCADTTARGALSCVNAPDAILRRVTRSDGAAVPDDHVIVLFGALGDLSKRKLLPGLFHLDRAGLMPERYKVIGTSRKGGTADEFRAVARKAVGDAAGETWEGFAQRLEFSAFSADEPEPLIEAVGRAESRARQRAAPAALPVDPAGRVRRHGRRARQLRACTSAPAWCSRSRSATTSTARAS